MEEPSVLDYIKSKQKFWQRGGKIELPPAETPSPASHPLSPTTSLPSTLLSSFPWRSLLALALALAGQRAFEPPHTTALTGIVLYLAAFGLLLWANLRGEWTLHPLAASLLPDDPLNPPKSPHHSLTMRRTPLLIGLPLALAAFLVFGGNLFTDLNLTLWLLALVFFIWAFWLRLPRGESIWARAKAFLAKENWQITITRWGLLVLAAVALVLFFRLHNLNEVPAEPFSDHAEKILDVYDITQGQTHIFFERNTGREGLQMYWTLLIASVFGTGLSFFSLKLGTALAGLGILPYMYLLGKEIANRRVGLLAMLFAGIAYWPNIISRAGLRFPLYPLFVAPTLYYLLRGLRTRSRNAFILSGLFLGLGLHGYSPFRIVPFIVVIAVGLYLLHSQSKGARKQAVIWLSLLALVSLFVFLPLLRYILENPAAFNYRAFSRLGTIEAPLPDSGWKIFFSNLWNALRMFNWDDGQIWVVSVTGRPALDVVSGALFVIGIILLLVRYVRRRHWLDLFLLLSIPLLLLPSILSLAFPAENPALNRAAGALVPVFLIVGLALDGLVTGLGRRPELVEGSGRARAALAWVVTGILLVWSMSQNYDLVFKQYDRAFRLGAWNSSEMGAVIEQFGQTYGSTDNAWIVPYPHWVDTRLPAIWVGIPNRDMATWRDDLGDTLTVPGAKLFIVKPEDTETVATLHQLYPQGTLSRYTSDIEDRDFLIFFVPAAEPPP
ncbi:MAG: glycosyltransferase family 39 protein [Anaerolineales bacterium]|nr:glycosyltransferase family 39 protein [Anaerolineales bacterium]